LPVTSPSETPTEPSPLDGDRAGDADVADIGSGQDAVERSPMTVIAPSLTSLPFRRLSMRIPAESLPSTVMAPTASLRMSPV
jgi:hypothetical protein